MEIVLVAVLALLVFGPRKLPEMARQIGKALNEFKRQTSDLKREFDASLDEDTETPAQAPGSPAPEGEQTSPDEQVPPGEPAPASAEETRTEPSGEKGDQGV